MTTITATTNEMIASSSSTAGVIAATTTTTATTTAAASMRHGEVGMTLASGEQVLTTSGRATTPFPCIDMSTSRRAANTLRRVDAWLLANARAEAEARDTGVVWRFGLDAAEVGNLSPADKDTFAMILFEPEFWRD